MICRRENCKRVGIHTHDEEQKRRRRPKDTAWFNAWGRKRKKHKVARDRAGFLRGRLTNYEQARKDSDPLHDVYFTPKQWKK